MNPLIKPGQIPTWKLCFLKSIFEISSVFIRVRESNWRTREKTKNKKTKRSHNLISKLLLTKIHFGTNLRIKIRRILSNIPLHKLSSEYSYLMCTWCTSCKSIEKTKNTHDESITIPTHSLGFQQCLNLLLSADSSSPLSVKTFS